MADRSKSSLNRRSSLRRSEDRQLRKQIDRYIQLFHVGQVITSEINFNVLFDVIIEQTNRIMETERCSIFLIDQSNQYLRAFVSTDLKKDEVRFPRDCGVAGWVFNHRTPVIIDDPYSDSRFYSEIDKQTGFRTKDILCVPLINRKDECIGTLQVLNKRSEKFSDDDREILRYVSNYVTVALENSMLYEELKASDTVKQKVIDHLSHELKTPLSITEAVFSRLSKTFQDTADPNLQRALERGRRNVARLFAIQEKVDDIVNRKSREDQQRYRCIIEHVADFVEELSEEQRPIYDEILDRISTRIKSIFHEDHIEIVPVRLDEFLSDLCSDLLAAIDRKSLQVRTDFQEGLFIHMDRNVLSKVCSGLLKNAVENTPDEGLIEITASSKDNEIRVDFRDHGVGITPDSRKNIFGGFFHTQDSQIYSSKKPFEFNAGGSGSDLLRMQVFAERFGFKLDFESERCPYIPLDSDVCPGRISACPHVKNSSECLAAGGSTFSLRFPTAGE